MSILALGACTYGTPVNNEGFYTDTDVTNVDWSAVNRTGSSCQTNLFGLIPFGDNSVPAAVTRCYSLIQITLCISRYCHVNVQMFGV